ncbi:MAG: MmcB family DNA repair protein [Hyphomicrobium sp.]|nr:MmcB family DNA repair protein [Hyphomicrobium sp.]
MTIKPAMHANVVTAEPAIETDERLAAQICRGVQRLLRDANVATLAEMPLGNGRRADIMAIGIHGDIQIVEIKSSIGDFRADRKWQEYRDYSDALSFAVAPDFPQEILPADTGLILADGYGGHWIRPAPIHRLSAARRKAVLLSFARIGAMRLHGLHDPSRNL